MTRILWRSLLIALMLIVAWVSLSEACHRRGGRYGGGGYYGGDCYGGGGCYGGGYATGGGGYYDGGYAGGMPGYPGAYGGYGGYGGYGYGRAYNPGGLGGPASGIGVRPSLGAGGFGPGR